MHELCTERAAPRQRIRRNLSLARERRDVGSGGAVEPPQPFRMRRAQLSADCGDQLLALGSIERAGQRAIAGGTGPRQIRKMDLQRMQRVFRERAMSRELAADDRVQSACPRDVGWIKCRRVIAPSAERGRCGSGRMPVCV